ncbi:MAG TPA: hypothetical protein VMD99_09460 [Terriglobales bacterium]|nr:hypothetical protein [Terriglobales bacterium]
MPFSFSVRAVYADISAAVEGAGEDARTTAGGTPALRNSSLRYCAAALLQCEPG